MEPMPIINVLVLTDLLSEGEQLVTIMRRGGLRVYAEAVRDEAWLHERLPGHPWDVLLAHVDNSRLPPQRLGTLLHKLQPDLFCIAVGSRSSREVLHDALRGGFDIPASLPCRELATSRIGNLTAPRAARQFLEILLNEFENLQTRRRLRHSAAVLTELQTRHHLLLTGTSDAVAYLHDGMHVYLNAAYARRFGHDDTEALMNTAFLDLLHDSQLDQARQLLRQQNPQGHHRLLGVDIHGLPCELNLHCSKVIYQREECLQFILHARDSARPHAPADPLPAPSLQSPSQIRTPLAAPTAGAARLARPADDNPQQQRLRLALNNADFRLLFQPIVGFSADALEHYAVRVGLNEDPCTVPCTHTSFSQRGKGERLDRLVLARCLARLRDLDRPGLRLVLGLTAGSMTQPGFLSWLRGQLAESPVESRGLVLQISEMDVVESPAGQIEDFCRQLHSLQVPLAVTHFGGSLEPFSHLPYRYVRYVELDESLTAGVDADADRFSRLQNTVSRLQANALKTISKVDRMTVLPALWQAGVCMVRGNCLQQAGPRLEYTFVRDEEITLTALP